MKNFMYKRITKFVTAGALLLLATSLAWAATTAQEKHSTSYNKMMANINEVQAQWDKAQLAVAALYTGKDGKYKEDKNLVVFYNLTKYLNGKAEILKAAKDSINKYEELWQADQKLGDKKKNVPEPDESLDDEVENLLPSVIADAVNTTTVDEYFNAWKACEINKLDVAISTAKTACNNVKNEKWFNTVNPRDIAAVEKVVTGVKADIDTAIMKCDLATLQNSCKTMALGAKDDAKAITTAVNAKAQSELNGKYDEVQGSYNTAYATMSEKYEATGELDKYQTDFIKNYLTPLLNHKAAIDEAAKQDDGTATKLDNTKTSSSIYTKTYKDLSDLKSNIDNALKENLSALENAIVEMNNKYYEEWTTTSTVEGSYAEVYKRYIDAAVTMNKYKNIVTGAETDNIITNTQATTILNDIKVAESDLYEPYTAIEQQKKDVLKVKEEANLNPSDRTTKYLSDLINEYIEKGKLLDVEIDNAVEKAKNAVNETAIKVVEEKAIKVEAMSVYDAYNAVGKYNNSFAKDNNPEQKSIAKLAQADIDTITIALYKDVKISAVVRNDVSVDPYYNGNYLYNKKYNINNADITVNEDVVNADNYEAVINDVKTNCETSINKLNELWKKRSDIATDEEKAIKEIENTLLKVRAYWTQAYATNEGNSTIQKTLVALRDDIDKLETSYDNAVKENDKTVNNTTRKKYAWERTAVQKIKDNIINGLTKSYNDIYPYAEPDKALITDELKTAAEEAVKELDKSITKAKEALTTIKREDKKVMLQNAIDNAEKEKVKAQTDITNAANKFGNDGDNSLREAKTTADKAKTTLENAIKDATVVEGDYNEDGVLDINDILDVKEDINGTTVTNTTLREIVKALYNR